MLALRPPGDASAVPSVDAGRAEPGRGPLVKRTGDTSPGQQLFLEESEHHAARCLSSSFSPRPRFERGLNSFGAGEPRQVFLRVAALPTSKIRNTAGPRFAPAKGSGERHGPVLGQMKRRHLQAEKQLLWRVVEWSAVVGALAWLLLRLWVLENQERGRQARTQLWRSLDRTQSARRS